MPDIYTELRGQLFSIAYRMLGRVGDAEDIVQEAFVRYQTSAATIDSPRAYLTAVTTRLCIDHLRSARVRRETYVGSWLPEPWLTSDDDPADAAVDAESLSMAFLLVLERLSPVERAVFLLRDVFAYEFVDIAGIVDKSEANVRQLVVRARRHVRENRPRFEASAAKRDALADRFLNAFSTGDLDALEQLLAADAVVTGDSGGVPPRWPHPIVGREKVARLFLGMAGQMTDVAGVHLERAQVNGQPGAVVRDGAGNLISVFEFEIADGAVYAVRSVIARDKLRHLAPLADVAALMAQRRTTNR